TLNLTVFPTTPLLVLMLTFRLTVICVGVPKVKHSPKMPRARIVVENPTPGVAEAVPAEKILSAANPAAAKATTTSATEVSGGFIDALSLSLGMGPIVSTAALAYKVARGGLGS